MKRKTVSLILITQIILILIILHSQLLPSTLASNNSIAAVEPGQSIQEAINNAADGQSILIKKGQYDIENAIIVNKTVTLMGEQANETIIDGQGTTTLILSILANEVEIQNLTVRNCATYGYGIHIKDVTKVKIQNCNIQSCSKGVVLTNSTNCELSRNLIADNKEYGIFFPTHSSYNLIFWNNIKNNSQAVSIDNINCKSNMFYQNNFIQNTLQTSGFGIPNNLWDNEYPAGGNYWSSYTGIDVKNGPQQNETGSDGIGDESYELYLTAEDHYPLMGPVHWFLAHQLETSSEYYVLVSSNVSEASNFHYGCPDESSISFTLTGNLNGFCRAAIPQQLLSGDNDSWLVTIDTEETERTLMWDTNYTYICFAHNYSTTKTVKIQGDYCVPEFSSPNMLIFLAITIIALVILKTAKTNAIISHRKRFQKA
jgi:parallel beta-helix repeat protein